MIILATVAFTIVSSIVAWMLLVLARAIAREVSP